MIRVRCRMNAAFRRSARLRPFTWQFHLIPKPKLIGAPASGPAQLRFLGLILAHSVHAAKRQPPSRRSGAMARRVGEGTGALQDAARFLRAIASRASVLDFRLRQTPARRGGGPPPLFPAAGVQSDTVSARPSERELSQLAAAPFAETGS